MKNKRQIFETETEHALPGNCYAIFNFCRVGNAVSDFSFNIDLTNKGGFYILLEAIAELASDAIERLETVDKTPKALPDKAT